MATSPSARVANIGTREQQKRLVWGVVVSGVGVVIAALLVMIRAPLIWRLPLFLLFDVGALGVFQARDKT